MAPLTSILNRAAQSSFKREVRSCHTFVQTLRGFSCHSKPNRKFSPCSARFYKIQPHLLSLLPSLPPCQPPCSSNTEAFAFAVPFPLPETPFLIIHRAHAITYQRSLPWKPYLKHQLPPSIASTLPISLLGHLLITACSSSDLCPAQCRPPH